MIRTWLIILGICIITKLYFTFMNYYKIIIAMNLIDYEW